MLRFLSALTLTASVLLAAAAAADVYKYTDEKGNVLYTDKPSHLPAERLNVQSQKTDVVATQARQEAEQQRMQNAEQARQQAATTRNEDRKAEQSSAADKAEQCKKARQRYTAYMTSQKLYEETPDGQRRYLTSEELDTARAQSKALMDEFCK